MEGVKVKTYLKINSCRKLDIKVIKNENEILYDGMVDDAPDEIKNLSYNRVDGGNPMIFYIENEILEDTQGEWENEAYWEDERY